MLYGAGIGLGLFFGQQCKAFRQARDRPSEGNPLQIVEVVTDVPQEGSKVERTLSKAGPRKYIGINARAVSSDKIVGGQASSSIPISAEMTALMTQTLTIQDHEQAVVTLPKNSYSVIDI